MQDDPRWYIADPICTFLFAILVLWTTRAILRDISDVLMERVPRGFCIKTLHDDLSRVGPAGAALAGGSGGKGCTHAEGQNSRLLSPQAAALPCRAPCTVPTPTRRMSCFTGA